MSEDLFGVMLVVMSVILSLAMMAVPLSSAIFRRYFEAKFWYTKRMLHEELIKGDNSHG